MLCVHIISLSIRALQYHSRISTTYVSVKSEVRIQWELVLLIDLTILDVLFFSVAEYS